MSDTESKYTSIEQLVESIGEHIHQCEVAPEDYVEIIKGSLTFQYNNLKERTELSALLSITVRELNRVVDEGRSYSMDVGHMLGKLKVLRKDIVSENKDKFPNLSV